MTFHGMTEWEKYCHFVETIHDKVWHTQSQSDTKCYSMLNVNVIYNVNPLVPDVH